MKLKKINLKTEDVLDEICKSANLLSEEIISHFSMDFYYTALGMTDKKFIPPNKNPKIFTNKDIEFAPIALDVLLAHEYMEGRAWSNANKEFSPSVFLSNMQNFYNLMEHIIQDKKHSKFAFLLNFGLARHKFDKGDDYFSFSELALLTGVDERTVRNASSSANEIEDKYERVDKYGRVGSNQFQKFGRLKTEKIGATLLVKREEAERWLQWRNFRFTEHIKVPASFCDKKTNNYSMQSTFCESVINQIQELNEHIMRKFESSFVALEKGIDPEWSIRQIIELSNALKIDWKDLFNRYMQSFYPEKNPDDNHQQKNASFVKSQIEDIMYLKSVLRVY